MKMFFDLKKLKKGTNTSVPEKQRLGKTGEEEALDYLLKLGYVLLEKNFRHSHSEIDLILKDGRCIVFCEVRSQNEDKCNYLSPAESITLAKRTSISQGAQWYISHYSETSNKAVKTVPPCRFDVVEVFFKDGKAEKINHIKDAFFKTQKRKGKGYRI